MNWMCTIRKKILLFVANHFQSNGLGKTKMNIEQENESASLYRYKRLTELLDANGKNTVQKTVNILRDQKGLNGANIGMGNEKAINQLIAHHSIIFEPKKLIVWVSTSPWQLGEYVAYDLNKIFALTGLEREQGNCRQQPDHCRRFFFINIRHIKIL